MQRTAVLREIRVLLDGEGGVKGGWGGGRREGGGKGRWKRSKPKECFPITFVLDFANEDANHLNALHVCTVNQ